MYLLSPTDQNIAAELCEEIEQEGSLLRARRGPQHTEDYERAYTLLKTLVDSKRGTFWLQAALALLVAERPKWFETEIRNILKG